MFVKHLFRQNEQFDGQTQDFALASNFDRDFVAGLVFVQNVVQIVVTADIFVVDTDDDVADKGAAVAAGQTFESRFFCG